MRGFGGDLVAFLSSNSVPTMSGICWFCHFAKLRWNGIPRFYHFIPCDKGQDGMLTRRKWNREVFYKYIHSFSINMLIYLSIRGICSCGKLNLWKAWGDKFAHTTYNFPLGWGIFVFCYKILSHMMGLLSVLVLYSKPISTYIWMGGGGGGGYFDWCINTKNIIKSKHAQIYCTLWTPN